MYLLHFFVLKGKAALGSAAVHAQVGDWCGHIDLVTVTESTGNCPWFDNKIVVDKCLPEWKWDPFGHVIIIILLWPELCVCVRRVGILLVADQEHNTAEYMYMCNWSDTLLQPLSSSSSCLSLYVHLMRSFLQFGYSVAPLKPKNYAIV